MSNEPNMQGAIDIAQRAGIDVESISKGVVGLAELGAIRGKMVAIEMLRAGGDGFAIPWIAELLDNYREAFGRPHPRDRGPIHVVVDDH